MKPRRLIPTELSEVSVLRRAANPLAKVLIRKSQQENDPMGDIGVVSIAKRSVSAITKGEIDQVSFAKLQLRLAQEQFPQDSLGVALTKFYATPHGAEMLNAGVKANYETMQRLTALTDSDVLKYTSPKLRHAKPQDEDEAGDHTDCTKTIADYMKTGMNFDQAASAYVRGKQ